MNTFGGTGINLNIAAPKDLQQKGLNVQIFMQVCRPAESIVATNLFARGSYWSSSDGGRNGLLTDLNTSG